MLDNKKIAYSYESVKIIYFSTQLNTYKTGIPDFIVGNNIIEVKSSYYYDSKDLSDRKKTINELGYNFYVFLDNKFLIEDFLDNCKDFNENNSLNIESIL